MTKAEAKTKMCPLMSTGFAADTENLRNEGVIYVECNPIKCMFWETTKTQKKATEVVCHRCRKTVSLKRNTCIHCNAFIRGYGATVPMIDLDDDKIEGRCRL